MQKLLAAALGRLLEVTERTRKCSNDSPSYCWRLVLLLEELGDVVPLLLEDGGCTKFNDLL